MPFPNKLRMEHIDGTERYKLIGILIWIDPDGKEWRLEIGTESDGHSIPKLLRSIAGSPFATKYPKSAIFHDKWCKTGIIPRREADKKYKQMMKEEGANKFQQIRNYAGVRVGSFFKWITSPFRKKK